MKRLLKRTWRTLWVLVGLTGFALWGGLAMSDMVGHMHWMKAHRVLLDINEPDETDRETRLKEAETMLRKATELSRDRAEVWNDLGRVADELRDLYRDADAPDEASRYADLAEGSHALAVSLSRENPRYWLALAWSAAHNQLFAKQSLSDAEFDRLDALFEGASRKAPHDPAVQFSCGGFWLMGDRVFDRDTRAKAVAAFAVCIAVDPARWIPRVREKFAFDPPSVEEMYQLVGSRRDLIRKLHASLPAPVTPLKREFAVARSAQH